MLKIDGVDNLRMRAIQDFYEVHRKAALEEVVGFLKRESTDLMAYEEIRRNLRPIESAHQVLEDIPLDKIIGSVNRTTDFTRGFLPRHSSDAHRWASVRMGFESMAGLPPIEAYRVDDVYFILDGHHRVSVARELGFPTIQGYVTPVYTRVPLSPDDSPDDLIIKSEYADFLAKTQVDHFRPEARFMVSVPGQYQKLLEHINVHHYFMGLQGKKEVSDKDAIADWYDQVYMPVIQVIRSRNLLRDFPHRTETDLYIWIMDNRAALGGNQIGWEVSTGKVAADLANRYSQDARHRLSRFARKLINLVLPATLEPGAPPGAWRDERQIPHRGSHLFDDILVTVIAESVGSSALNIALEFAKHEEARLTGFHVVKTENQKDSDEVQKLTDWFLRQCAEAEVPGRMLVQAGTAADLLCQRSPWVDLSVFRLSYPPPSRVYKRLKSGIRKLIHHSVSPLLAVPDAKYALDSALLAYGPGRKSEEALFVAAYLACTWKIPLTVISIVHADAVQASRSNPLDGAKKYLEAHEIRATYIVEKSSDPSRSILLNAEAHNAGFIITGGYEGNTMKEAVFGSTVDRILRSTRRPVLICR